MSDEPLSPEEVANRRFATTFRGLDPEEVGSYLARVAEELRSSRRREEELKAQLAQAEHRAAHPEWDEAAVSNAIGEQTSRILESAQTVAHELKAKAEDNAARILRDAHGEAQRIKEDAETVLAKRTEEAEAESDKIREAAQSEAESLLANSRREAESTRRQAEAYATDVVEEAQANQRRILGELSRRRRIAHAQVEQLRAGRERLLEAYRVVRRTLDEVVSELQRAEPEARLAAEAAVRRLGADAGLTESPMDEPVPREEPEEDEKENDKLPSGELTVVRPPSEIEAVRILGPKPVSEPEPEPEPQAAVEPQPEPEAEPEAETGPEPEAGPERETEPEPEEPQPELEPEPEPEPVTAMDREPDLAAGSSSSPVEQLFARIRADRATAVARANQVLRTGDPPGETKDLTTPPTARPSLAVVATGEIRTDETGTDETGTDEVGEAPLTEEEEAQLQRRDGVLEPITSGLARRLKRVLQDEQNEVLDRLRSVRGSSPKGDNQVLPPGDDQTVRYAGAGEDLLRQAVEAGGQFFRGGPVDSPDVTDLALGLAESLTKPLRRQLHEGWAGAGEDEQAAVVQRIGAAYRECKAQRVDGLAADAVIGAFSRGILAAKAATHLRWVVQDEAGPCPDCDDNALAGPTPLGESFPTGQEHPPAHGGCRCLLVPAT